MIWRLKISTCYKVNNRGKKVYGCANFITKENAGVASFNGFRRQKLESDEKMGDNLFTRVEKIERSIDNIQKSMTKFKIVWKTNLKF